MAEDDEEDEEGFLDGLERWIVRSLEPERIWVCSGYEVS